MTADACSIAAALGVVGDRWTVLILRDVFRGVHRFTDLHHDLGIARNLLSDRLALLVEQGVLRKVRYSDRPPRWEYRLTAKGADLSPALVALMRWGDRWYAPEGPPTVLYHAACGTPLTHRPRCPHCDTDVVPTQIRGRPGPGSPAAHGPHRSARRPDATPPVPAPPVAAPPEDAPADDRAPEHARVDN